MTAILRISRVTACFGGVTAVDDVSFDVAAGELLGLIGPNGAGKTTIMRSITGIVKPDRGKIELNGEGFFKVKKDKEHPFQVVCNETTTTVLGTSFTVREDLKDGVSVKLYEGSVQMSVKDSTQNWLLAPGEKFIYSKQTVSIEAFNRFVDFDNDGFLDIHATTGFISRTRDKPDG